MSKKFDLDKFLKNYKPKPRLSIETYLKTKKLSGYNLMINVTDLKSDGCYYIKCIHKMDAFSDENYESHVHSGGMFMSGGYYNKRRFVKSKYPTDWTHLMLKFDPPQQVNDLGVIVKDKLEKPRIFFINISEYHIFYKICRRGRGNFEIILKNLDSQ